MKKCSYCGKEYPDDATHCALDQERLGDSRWEPNLHQDKSPTAGFGIRVLARMLDTLFGAAIGYLAALIAGSILVLLNSAGELPPHWQGHLVGFSLVTTVFAIFGNMAYHTFCEGIYGSTLGKFCCGICVLTQDMKRPDMSGAFIRTVGYYFDGLFFGLVGFNSMSQSPLNQRYGDVWGKTVVVYIWKLPPEARPMPNLFIVGLLAGAGIDILLIVIGLILRTL